MEAGFTREALRVAVEAYLDRGQDVPLRRLLRRAPTADIRAVLATLRPYEVRALAELLPLHRRFLRLRFPAAVPLGRVAAGWPGEPPLVGSVSKVASVCLRVGDTVRQAVGRLNRLPADDGSDCLFLLDQNDRLLGEVPLTALLTPGDLEAPVERLAQPPAVVLAHNEEVRHALRRLGNGWGRTLPVTDAAGRLKGVVNWRALWQAVEALPPSSRSAFVPTATFLRLGRRLVFCLSFLTLRAALTSTAPRTLRAAPEALVLLGWLLPVINEFGPCLSAAPRSHRTTAVLTLGGGLGAVAVHALVQGRLGTQVAGMVSLALLGTLWAAFLLAAARRCFRINPLPPSAGLMADVAADLMLLVLFLAALAGFLHRLQ